MSDLTLETVLRVTEILSILGGGGIVAFRLGRNTQRVEAAIKSQAESSTRQNEEISQLKAEIKKLNDVLTQLAVQQSRLDTMAERITTLDRRYEDLRHGEGFVFPIGSHLGGKS